MPQCNPNNNQHLNHRNHTLIHPILAILNHHNLNPKLSKEISKRKHNNKEKKLETLLKHIKQMDKVC